MRQVIVSRCLVLYVLFYLKYSCMLNIDRLQTVVINVYVTEVCSLVFIELYKIYFVDIFKKQNQYVNMVFIKFELQ